MFTAKIKRLVGEVKSLKVSKGRPHSTMSNKKNTPSDPTTRLEPRLQERLAAKKNELDSFRPLTPSLVKQLHEELRVALTYHSNAIESNTLSLHETKMVVEYGLTIGGHNLREHLEATNHAEAFDQLQVLVGQPQQPLTLEIVTDLHRLVMDKIDPQAGKFRSNYVHITGALGEPPPRAVARRVEEWLDWLNSHNNESKDYHPVVYSAIAHQGFEAVHPFSDGNGRTGRLILNFLLMRGGYPPALVLKDWRGAYITALRNGDEGNYAPLANLIGRSVESSFDTYLDACRHFPEELHLPLSELARTSGYDVNYLGGLVRQGHLEATKRKGRWYSTVVALAKYQEQAQQGRQRRGRPPKSV